MIGLLKKDLYVADKSARLLLILALVFSLIPNMATFGSTYAIVMAMTIPFNAVAYDEKCKWDRYAAMLPYKVRQLVGTKYLLAYIFGIVAEGILLLGMLVRNILQPGSAPWEETLSLSVLLLISMVFVTALALPALYRFGSERARLIMILIAGVFVGVVLGLMGVFGELPALRLSLPVLAALVAAAAVGVTLLSFRLSVYFYKKRQNGAYN